MSTCFTTNLYFGLLEIQSLVTFCKCNTSPFLCQVVKSVQHHMTVLLLNFHLDVHTCGFHTPAPKLEPPFTTGQNYDKMQGQ